MDLRDLLRQIQAGQAQYTPQRVAALRRYYESLGGAALDAAEAFRRQHDMPASDDDTQPSEYPSWPTQDTGQYPL